MSGFFTTVFYQPLYNGLIFLIGVLPWVDAGVAVIIFTIIIKLILFPLSIRAVKTQLKMKQVEPELALIREKYKNNREEQTRKTLEMYKTNDIHPFSGIFLLLLQLPVIFALYAVFQHGISVTDTSQLYSFVRVPAHVNSLFLGLIDISQKSLILAFLTGLSQFFQARFAVPPPKPRGEKPSFQEDLARSMSLQVRFVLPVFIFFIAWGLPAVVSLYWITSNLFMIAQELYIRRKYKRS